MRRFTPWIVLLAGLLMCLLAVASHATSRPQGGSYTPGAVEPPGSTLTLVNDNTSTGTAAGTPTRLFGWPFAPGAVPSGQVPVFTCGANGTQLYSMSPKNAARYWPDGSLAFAVFALRPNFTIAASGSTTCTITAQTGSYPTASRSVATDLYPQALAVIAPILASSPKDAGTGPWGAWITSANASNLKATRIWVVGPAGDVYGLTYEMSATQGGAPHGLLVTDFYVHILTDGSGNLGGFRWWADIRQPYIDRPTTGDQTACLATPGPCKDFRYFAPPDAANLTTTLHWQQNGTNAVPPNWEFPPAGVTVTAAPVLHWSGTGFISGGTGLGNAAFNTSGTILTVGPGCAGNTPPYGPGCTTTSGSVGNIAVGDAVTGTGVTATTTTSGALGGNAWNVSGAAQNTGATPVSITINGLSTPSITSSFSDAVLGPNTYNLLPAIISSSTIGGLSNGFHFLSNQANNGQPDGTISFYDNGNTAGGPIILTGGGGTATVLPIPVSQPYERFPIGDKNGEYISFKGSGSITTDVPLRSGKVDLAHWVNSRLLPPYDTTQTCSSLGGNIIEWYWPSNNVPDYGPYTTYWLDNLGGGGDGPYYAAPLPFWAIFDMYCGTYSPGYKSNLYWALNSPGLIEGDVVATAKPTVPINLGGGVSPTGTTRTYTGMSTALPTLGGGGSVGAFSFPSPASGTCGPSLPCAVPTNSQLGPIGHGDSAGWNSHWPSWVYWIYLRTGRLELLDRMAMQTTNAMWWQGPRPGSGYTFPVTIISGKNYYNIRAFGSQERQNSWSLRDLGYEALVRPDDPSGLNNSGNVAFDGSQYAVYLMDTLDDNYAFRNDLVDPTLVGCSSPSTSSAYPEPPNPAGTCNQVTSTKQFMNVNINQTASCGVSARYGGGQNWWAPGFSSFGANADLVLAGASAVAYFANLSTWVENYVNNRGGLFNIYDIGQMAGAKNSLDNCGGTQDTLWANDNQWLTNPYFTLKGMGSHGPGGNYVQFNTISTAAPSTSQRDFQVVGPFANGYVLSNNDYLMWDGNYPTPITGGLNPITTYIACDVLLASTNTYNFNLKAPASAGCGGGSSYITPGAVITDIQATANCTPQGQTPCSEPPYYRSNSNLTTGCASAGCLNGYMGILHADADWANATMVARGLTVPPGITALINDGNTRIVSDNAGVWYFPAGTTCGGPVNCTDARWMTQAHY